MNFKESKEGYMRAFERREGKKKLVELYYNLQNKRNNRACFLLMFICKYKFLQGPQFSFAKITHFSFNIHLLTQEQLTSVI